MTRLRSSSYAAARRRQKTEVRLWKSQSLVEVGSWIITRFQVLRRRRIQVEYSEFHTPHMKLHKNQCYFCEVSHEKNQIRSHALVCAFSYSPHSAFQLPNSSFAFYAHTSSRGVDLRRSSPWGFTLTVYPNRPEISQIKLQP